ncbi:MAG: hypothetical protein KIS87_05225 [Phycisphaeraceae bacterium]|nr:hypothetical protein [Phycisphaeraceae bacterium]
MKISDAIRRLNVVQRSLAFKVIASIVIVAGAIAGFAAYVVYRTAPLAAPLLDGGAEADGRRSGAPDDPIESTRRALEQILSARTDTTSLGVVIAASAGLALLVTWFGLALTYLALVAVVALVAVPLALMDGTRDLGLLIGGAAALTGAFTILLETARMALSGSGPVRAVARNVLAEAVRMKFSLVFIVILIVGLAGLPGVLDESQPLRYRVQTFMSFGTGLSYWVIAALTVLFSAATVTFEQRDRIIWQTMTKPVAAWQYVLGKWLGVTALSGVLLVVCATGVFLFVDYLRTRPAVGEREAYVAASRDEWVTEDRLVLETQVLAARVTVDIDPPVKPTDPEFRAAVEEFIRNERVGNESFARDPAERRKVEEDLYKSWERSYRAIEPGGIERFIYRGLAPARSRNAPLTFRHRVDAGSNAPDEFVYVTFIFGTDSPQVYIRRMSPGFYHTMTVPASIIDSGGEVRLTVINGDIEAQAPNRETVGFPPGGLELSYSAGSYRANFARGILLLWAKVAFLSMLTILASTSLSFPVTCLVAFGAFLAAEGSVYMSGALENFRTDDDQGNPQPLLVLAEWITLGVSWVFSGYGGIRPTTRLVEGVLITWGEVARGVAILAGLSSVVYGAAVVAFRRRELATYSGR